LRERSCGIDGTLGRRAWLAKRRQQRQPVLLMDRVYRRAVLGAVGLRAPDDPDHGRRRLELAGTAVTAMAALSRQRGAGAPARTLAFHRLKTAGRRATPGGPRRVR